MDGENNGKPDVLMDDLRGVNPPFQETPIWQKWLHPPKFESYGPWKMVGLEDDPFLVGLGNFSGAMSVKLRGSKNIL